MISLAEGNPAAALAAVADVLDGTAPVIGDVTLVETHLLAGLARRELGDQRAANQAAERALALAEPDRLVLPFVMTGSGGLLEALPRHDTAHAALLTDILDVVHGSSLAAKDQSASPPTEELSPTELRVLRYLPTKLSRPEIASELSVSVNTVSTHVRNIYAKLPARDRSSAVQRARELRLLSAGPAREHGHLILVMRIHLPPPDHGLMDPAPVLYMIRIHGHLGATVLFAFPALVPQRHGADTVLTGLLDRSALYGVLAEIEALGLDLLEVRQLTPQRRSPESGDSRSP